MELTILMPCLDEAETLETCISKAMGFLHRSGIDGEVLISDNGSTDGSQEIARAAGARVIDAPIRGYGGALQAGLAGAHGEFIIMGDADDSYDFEQLDGYVEQLRAGADLVMGNRFRGGIAPGAMPALHKYLGNPVLSTIGRVLFRSEVKDFHCGLRGFRKEAMEALSLKSSGMEFASEMVVKSTLNRLEIVEIPTTLSQDGRSRPPHLRSWRDGWRHLRFLLMLAPRWLFLYPGFMMVLLGLIGAAFLIPGPVSIGRVEFDIATLAFAMAFLNIGAQAVLYSRLANRIAISRNLFPDPGEKFPSLEAGLLVGAAVFIAGLGLSITALSSWGQAAFGGVDLRAILRLVIPAISLMMLGFQIALHSFVATLTEA